MTLRLPLRALPLAIKATHLAANACAYAWAALADLHADLVALHEPRDVSDLCPTPFGMSDAELDAEESFLRHWREHRICFECGTSDPTGFCPAHRVLDKGRVN